MAAGLLYTHRMVQHGKAKAERWSCTDAATGGGGGGEPTTYLIERFPRGDEGLPSGGLPGKGRDADGEEGTFMAQTGTGRHDHLGGGKPPSSKVPTMRHAGPEALPKWEAQEHRDVQEWGGEEEAATGGDRDTVKHGDGL